MLSNRIFSTLNIINKIPLINVIFETGKKGLTQKEQIEVVKRFREGGYNTLVATCVGEEGLDIGEVDLVNIYIQYLLILISYFSECSVFIAFIDFTKIL